MSSHVAIEEENARPRQGNSKYKGLEVEAYLLYSRKSKQPSTQGCNGVSKEENNRR